MPLFGKKKALPCGYCGKEFERFPSQIYGTKNYCSRECKWQAERAPNLVCGYCGTQFHRPVSEIAKTARNNSTRAFCSRECYERARADVPEGHRPNGRWGKHNVMCAQCGKEMYLRPSRLKNKDAIFCSEKCMHEFRRTHSARGLWAAREDSLNKFTRCQRCGLQEPEILHIHHIDGNRKNNRPENLLVLCPNCHMKAHKK